MVAGATAGDVATGLVRLSVGGVGFAVPIDAVATVMAASQVVRENDDGEVLVGHVPSRFGAIPVADSSRLFGVGAVGQPHGAGQQLIVLHGSPPVGLLVDDVTTSTSSVSDETLPLSPLCGHPERLLVNAVVWNEQETFDLVIDLPAIREAVLGIASRLETDRVGDVPMLPILDVGACGQSLDVLVGAASTRIAIPLAAIRHIDDVRQPSPLPRADPAILGLLSWRRHPIPLLDPCQLMGLAPMPPNRLVVLGVPEPSTSAPDDVVCALAVRDITGIK